MSISHEDLAGRWSLSFSDIEFVTGKPVPARLGVAVQLKFFATHGFFVQDRSAIPVDGISFLAEQLGFGVDALSMSVAQIIMLIIGAFFFTALQAVAYSGMIIGIHLFLRAMGMVKAKDNQTLRLYRWLAVVVSVGAGAAQAGEIYFSDAYLSSTLYKLLRNVELVDGADMLRPSGLRVRTSAHIFYDLNGVNQFAAVWLTCLFRLIGFEPMDDRSSREAHGVWRSCSEHPSPVAITVSPLVHSTQLGASACPGDGRDPVPRQTNSNVLFADHRPRRG